VVLTITLVMALLFLALIYIVKRGENIIRQRAQEQIKLKEQLSRAQHMSSIGEMVAGVSHEIRNPLGIISSSAALLKKKIAHTEPSNAIPDIIIEEAARLNSIITDFLNFAKPRQPDFTDCNIEKVLEKNLKFLASDIQDKGYRIQREAITDLPSIKADPDMLYQVFLNILINAMQSMPSGGDIKILVTADDRQVAIEFQDSGTGIADDIKEKIWNPFFTTKEKGTGLGLGIVKKIIEMHEGSIRIENRQPKGVSVTVALPID
jgi:two-component system, NtrC family, sensor histidine kinase HydH